MTSAVAADRQDSAAVGRAARVGARLTDWWDRLRHHVLTAHPAAWLTAAGIFIFGVVFGRLAVQNHANFGTWAYDSAIYDQGFWLVSRGHSFMTVRGMDFWGHHVNLIAIVFVPFYWLGAGLPFLYVVQAVVLGLAAWPVYLIARDAFRTPWMGGVFAIVYLLYAPVQWISRADFHPEALVICPFMFAWWFATKERWTAFWVMVVISLSIREDVALAVVMMGIVLLVHMRHAPDFRRVRKMAILTSLVGALWYVAATKVVLPLFNDGEEPFYITYFYGHYGKDSVEILSTMIQRPDRVISDAVQHDRLVFYKQMGWPMGWTFLFNPLALLMALPQLVASVITATPYARMIRYQYTAVMNAPIVIASIYGARTVWNRFPWAKIVLPLWLLGCAYTTNVAWSPSPLSDANYTVWAGPSPRHASLNEALSLIPDDAAVVATYQLGPHLAHREDLFDWPSPFMPHYWGNDDCKNLPDPTVVDYLILDLTQIDDPNNPAQRQLFIDMLKPGGPFEAVFMDENVVVAHRIGTSPEVDVQPQRDSCQALELRKAAATRG